MTCIDPKNLTGDLSDCTYDWDSCPSCANNNNPNDPYHRVSFLDNGAGALEKYLRLINELEDEIKESNDYFERIDLQSDITDIHDLIEDLHVSPVLSQQDVHNFELAVGADELYAVYATLDTDLGPHRVRVSEFSDNSEALDLHERLHGLYRDPSGLRVPENGRPVSYPGYSVYGRSVISFAVRSATDSDWPASRPALTLRDHATNERVNTDPLPLLIVLSF